MRERQEGGTGFMNPIRKAPLSLIQGLSLAPGLGIVVALLCHDPAPLLAQAQKSYLVIQLTDTNGKVTHKALAEKDQDSFKKSAEEDYQKARKSYQEEKKAFQKDAKGKKFSKLEPQKPRLKVIKTGIKTYNEAVKTAFDLDRELERKNGKNGNGKGKANGDKGNGEKKREGKEEDKKGENGDKPPAGGNGKD